MYAIDTDKCTALDIIQRSMTCHPSLFREALERVRADDLAYGADKTGQIALAVKAHANAAKRALSMTESEDASVLLHDMGAGIIALNIACKLQCLPAHVRTASALRTWED